MLDFALLVDGLQAEREQGITIDVAYRYFSTARRQFIVADTPGHEQYTRNMATGASTADLAVVLVDARKGVLAQTRRHSCIVSLLGIRQVVLAVNKMDLVGLSTKAASRRSPRTIATLAERLGLADGHGHPAVGAARRQRHRAASPPCRGIAARPCCEHLETCRAHRPRDGAAFRLPVQWVNRPDSDFRGFAGTIAGRQRRAGR